MWTPRIRGAAFFVILWGIAMSEEKGYLRLPETKVALIALAHCVNDTYAAYVSTFIPFIKANLGLTYALASSFNVVVGIFHIICQPIVGYLCDRIRRPLLMMAGPVLCGLGAVMVPNSGSFGAAVFCAGLWGFGSALYHPQGAGGIGYVSTPEKLTRSLTWYNIAGTVGTMLSPLIAVMVVKTLGYQWLFVTLAPAVLIAFFIYFSMPFLRDKTSVKKRQGFFPTIGGLFALLYPIWAVALIRDLLFQCVRFLLPMKIAMRGGDLESVGTIVFCLTLGGALGMIPMEAIARRFGGKKTLKWSLFVGAAFLFAATLAKGLLEILLNVLGVACVYSTLSLTVSMAQKLAPSERSAASSIVLGLSWGFSNILVSPFGKLADLLGLDATFVVLAALPLMGVPFLWTRPFREMTE